MPHWLRTWLIGSLVYGSVHWLGSALFGWDRHGPYHSLAALAFGALVYGGVFSWLRGVSGRPPRQGRDTGADGPAV